MQNAFSISLSQEDSSQENEAALKCFTVSEINALISDVLTSSLPTVIYIEGEISNLSVAASGHRYFSLVDGNSHISCALFKGAARLIDREFLSQLVNGAKVTLKASLSVYKPRGNYQLLVQSVEPAGFGDAAKAFALLKDKLDKKGYTQEKNKKDIPFWPKGIGVVTSPTGAAIEDVLSTLKRRSPFLPVFVFPTLVQGDLASQQIAEAINQANQNEEIETLLLVRGGGSQEDLSVFNTELVAMAVVDSKLPVISGVGHEVDYTIVDFVSDYRAATPTAAAEKSGPDKAQLQLMLDEKQKKLNAYQQHRLSQFKEQLRALNSNLLKLHPNQKLAQDIQKLDQLSAGLYEKTVQRHLLEKQRVFHLRQRLQLLSPINQLREKSQRLSDLHQRLGQCFPARRIEVYRNDLARTLVQLNDKINLVMRQKKTHLNNLTNQLQLLSPLGTLDRGYAILKDDSGKVITKAGQFVEEQAITIKLSDGELHAIIKSIDKEK